MLSVGVRQAQAQSTDLIIAEQATSLAGELVHRATHASCSPQAVVMVVVGSPHVNTTMSSLVSTSGSFASAHVQLHAPRPSPREMLYLKSSRLSLRSQMAARLASLASWSPSLHANLALSSWESCLRLAGEAVLREQHAEPAQPEGCQAGVHGLAPAWHLSLHAAIAGLLTSMPASRACALQEKQYSESSTLSLRNQKTARLVSMAPDQAKLPCSYTSNSRQECTMLEHCRSFSATFLEGYPHRPPPYLTPRYCQPEGACPPGS